MRFHQKRVKEVWHADGQQHVWIATIFTRPVRLHISLSFIVSIIPCFTVWVCPQPGSAAGFLAVVMEGLLTGAHLFVGVFLWVFTFKYKVSVCDCTHVIQGCIHLIPTVFSSSKTVLTNISVCYLQDLINDKYRRENRVIYNNVGEAGVCATDWLSLWAGMWWKSWEHQHQPDISEQSIKTPWEWNPFAAFLLSLYCW